MILLHNVAQKLNSSNINTLLEIGSRDGNDSSFFQQTWGLENENIYIIEPNPTTYPDICKRYPNYTVYDYAINSYDGECEFNAVYQGGVGVSSIKDRYDSFYNTSNTRKATVKCLTGKSLLNLIKKDIDYCQIDVEGLAYEVIESFGSTIKNIKFILVECEHRKVWKDQKLYSDVEELLSQTHNIIYSDYKEGNLQSNSLWEIKKQ